MTNLNKEEKYYAEVFEILFNVPYFDKNGDKIEYTFIGIND